MIRYLNVNVILNNKFLNTNLNRFYSRCESLVIKLTKHNVKSNFCGRDLLFERRLSSSSSSSLSVLGRVDGPDFESLKNNSRLNSYEKIKICDITKRISIRESNNVSFGGGKKSLSLYNKNAALSFSRSSLCHYSLWSKLETRRKRAQPFFYSQFSSIVSHYSSVTYYPLGGAINGGSSSSSSSSSFNSSIINNNKSIKRYINDKKSKLNMSVFKFSDYDCVGFDLDNTLLRYNITNMVKLEYECLKKFLIEKRSYDSKNLNKELKNVDFDFMQKGLVIDFERGNILRFSPDGKILRASHGTRLLSEEKLDEVYSNRRWEVTDTFKDDPLVTWNGPLSEKMRTLLDYFDMPASLAFARVVDTIDENNGGESIGKYNVWPDVLDGLVDMFDRENFGKNEGRYFPELKNNPDKYLMRSSEKLVDWLKELKKRKLTYLITGSNSDFANFTASYALGDNWRSLFDVVICYAKKPGFFTGSRQFLKVKDGGLDGEIVSVTDLERGGIYSQGNWKGLKEFFSNQIGNHSPKCLYVGDNLIQDVYTPNRYADCDTVAVVEEQLSEGMFNHCLSHDDEKILNSKIWGSYFNIDSNGKMIPSIWNDIIKNCSKICVPSVDFIINDSLDTPIKCFSNEDEKSGYYPGKPKSVDML